MINKAFLKCTYTSLLVGSLFACGGSDSSNSYIQEPTPAQLLTEYSGSTESATLSEEEIYPILNYIFYGDATAFIESSLTAVASSALRSLAREKNQSKASTRSTQTEECGAGGTVTLINNVNLNNGVGQLTYQYDQCETGNPEDGIFSGSYTNHYYKWTETYSNPTNFKTIFSNFRQDFSDGSYSEFHGVISEVHEDDNYCNFITTSNLLYKTDKISFLENELIVEVTGCDNTYDEVLVNGQIFVSDRGYFDVNTQAPITLNDEADLLSGTFTLSNEKNTVVLDTIDAQTSIKVDENNNSLIEFELIAPSWHFTNQPFRYVRDDDQDGYANINDYYPNNSDIFEPLTSSHSEIAIASIYGSDLPISETLLISGSNVDWKLSSSASWLILSENNGKGDEEVGFTLGSLSVGKHQTQLTLLNEVDGDTLIIDVSVDIVLPTLSLTTERIEFDGTDNWDEIIKSLSLSINTGNNNYPVDYVVSLTNNDILDVVTSDDSVSESLTTVDLTLNPAILSAGNIKGEITFTSHVLDEEISATLNVDILSSSHLLLVPDSGIAFSKFLTTEALHQSIDIFDSYGFTDTNWSATTTSEWLTITASGTTADKLTVTANEKINDLPSEAFYSASIVVSSNNLAVENSQTINVGLWIGSSDPQSFSEMEIRYLHLTADPIRPYVYLNNESSTIDIYNVYSRQLISTINEVGTSLGDMEVSADGNELYVADTSDNSIIIIDLDNTNNRSVWQSADSLEKGFTLAVTNNVALLISGGGSLYDAKTGKLYLSDAHEGTYGYSYLDVSLFGNRFCAVSYYNLKCYELDYKSYHDIVTTLEMPSIPHKKNGIDVALNNDGSEAYFATLNPYLFAAVNLDTMTIDFTTYLANSYPNAVEIGPENTVHGAADTAYGPNDIWIFVNGELKRSEYVSDYADGILDRSLVVSGDGLMNIALTTNPSIAFVTSF